MEANKARRPCRMAASAIRFMPALTARTSFKWGDGPAGFFRGSNFFAGNRRVGRAYQESPPRRLMAPGDDCFARRGSCMEKHDREFRDGFASRNSPKRDPRKGDRRGAGRNSPSMLVAAKNSRHHLRPGWPRTRPGLPRLGSWRRCCNCAVIDNYGRMIPLPAIR